MATTGRTLGFVRALLMATAMGSCHGTVVTSRLQVHIPQSLSKPDGYDHRDALFGIPPYGGSIQQQVYYADADLCNPRVDTTRGYPERPKVHGKMASWESPYILLVDRGGCTFVQKVRNAQRAGATAVLIADDSCLCADFSCMNVSGISLAECEMAEPIMADDGSGADISIPSFLIFKHDGDAIKTVLKNNQPVRVEMKFSVPAPNSRVEYELWTTPRDSVSKEFLSKFYAAASALGTDATFTPHEFVLDGVRAGCQGPNGDDFCANLCTNSGKYCSLDPDNDLNSGASGADVVAESLRRLCIWDTYGSDGIGKEWWDYIAAFTKTCDNSPNTDAFKDPTCIQEAMKTAKIDSKKIDRCMKKSGGLEGNTNNTFFELQQNNIVLQGVFLVPSLYVNGAPVRGALSFETAFKAVCAGFAVGYEPETCQKCSACHDMEGCVAHGSCSNGSSGKAGVSLTTFAVSFIFLTLTFGIVGYVVHQRQQHAMQQQVRGIMAQYMPIDKNPLADTSLGLDEEDEDFSNNNNNNSGGNNGTTQFTIT